MFVLRTRKKPLLPAECSHPSAACAAAENLERGRALSVSMQVDGQWPWPRGERGGNQQLDPQMDTEQIPPASMGLI